MNKFSDFDTNAIWISIINCSTVEHFGLFSSSYSNTLKVIQNGRDWHYNVNDLLIKPRGVECMSMGKFTIFTRSVCLISIVLIIISDSYAHRTK